MIAQCYSLRAWHASLFTFAWTKKISSSNISLVYSDKKRGYAKQCQHHHEICGSKHDNVVNQTWWVKLRKMSQNALTKSYLALGKKVLIHGKGYHTLIFGFLFITIVALMVELILEFAKSILEEAFLLFIIVLVILRSIIVWWRWCWRRRWRRNWWIILAIFWINQACIFLNDIPLFTTKRSNKENVGSACI